MKTLLKNRRGIWAKLVLTLALLTAAACTTKTFSETPQLPPDVEVAGVEQRDVPIYREWIGTLDGMVNAAIKVQVIFAIPSVGANYWTAYFPAVVMQHFSSHLARIKLEPRVGQQIENQRVKLAAIEIPQGLEPRLRADV